MSTETKEAAIAAATEEGLAIVLPPHLTENFETAQRKIAERYGESPDIPALMRLWIACATSARIQMEFERAVLDINKRGFDPHEEDYFDDNGR